MIQEAAYILIDGENAMTANGLTASVQASASSLPPRRRRFFISGLALRLLIAFILSWLIVMAFFATGAISH
jgi:hypothetical protein